MKQRYDDWCRDERTPIVMRNHGRFKDLPASNSSPKKAKDQASPVALERILDSLNSYINHLQATSWREDFDLFPELSLELSLKV